MELCGWSLDALGTCGSTSVEAPAGVVSVCPTEAEKNGFPIENVEKLGTHAFVGFVAIFRY